MTSNIKSRFPKKQVTDNIIPEIPKYAKAWVKLEDLFAKKGQPGLTYIKTVFNQVQCVESIIYRGESGKLMGMVEYFPMDIAKLEKKGNVNVLVHPAHNKKGIGTILLIQAVNTWDIDFDKQLYTPAGLRLLEHFQKFLLW